MSAPFLSVQRRGALPASGDVGIARSPARGTRLAIRRPGRIERSARLLAKFAVSSAAGTQAAGDVPGVVRSVAFPLRGTGLPCCDRGGRGVRGESVMVDG